MTSLGLDWDDTLVDGRTQEWLPDAVFALRALLQGGCKPFIHSCRANWPEGREQIRSKLAEVGLERLEIHGKPFADVYVDDRNVHFRGDWKELATVILSAAIPAGPMVVPRRKPTVRKWPRPIPRW